MKILVNGGLNLSELDGWWAEAYAPELGWAIGDGHEHYEPGWDAAEIEQLYQLLEQQVVPEFYERDAEGIPRAWVARIRASLSRLTPRFSSNRMLAEYLDQLYLPAAGSFRRRTEHDLRMAHELRQWMHELHHRWPGIHWGNLEVAPAADGQVFRVQVYLGELEPDTVRVELYAEPRAGSPAERVPLRPDHALSGSAGGFLYVATVPSDRPAGDYTPRVVPAHAEAMIPAETRFISWYPA